MRELADLHEPLFFRSLFPFHHFELRFRRVRFCKLANSFMLAEADTPIYGEESK
jgi:hypothetical protein